MFGLRSGNMLSIYDNRIISIKLIKGIEYCWEFHHRIPMWKGEDTYRLKFPMRCKAQEVRPVRSNLYRVSFVEIWVKNATI